MTDLIIRKFELINEDEADRSFTDAELFQLLCDRITYMIEHKLDYLLSLLYRLDIDEQKINAALHPSAPDVANIGLAKLVLERQQARNETKQTYKVQNSDNWSWDEE